MFGEIDATVSETVTATAHSWFGDWQSGLPWMVSEDYNWGHSDQAAAVTSPGFIGVEYWGLESIAGAPNNNTNFGQYGGTNAPPNPRGTPPATNATPVGNPDAPAKPRTPLVPENIGNSTVQAIKAIFGFADSRVQSAFDQSNWDRSHGTADAAAAYVGISGGVGGHTFDGDNRDAAAATATTIITATDRGVMIVTGAQGEGKGDIPI